MDLDLTEPNWDDPASLRACAARLRLQATQMAVEAAKFQRFKPVEHDPFSVSDMLSDSHVVDPAEAEARARDFRTAEARRQIMDALDAEKREVEQQQRQDLQQFYQTPIGKLLR
jgi:hypothetical protein